MLLFVFRIVLAQLETEGQLIVNKENSPIIALNECSFSGVADTSDEIRKLIVSCIRLDCLLATLCQKPGVFSASSYQPLPVK